MIYRIFTPKYIKILIPLAMTAVGSAASVLATNDTKAIEKAVLGANESFYRAFAERDIAKMDTLWATDKPVAVIHPGWPGLEGREAVMDSWKQILVNPTSPKIRVTNASAYVYGEVAFVICYELIGEGMLIATNIFVLQDDKWKIVHHQAGATLGMTHKPKGEPI